MRMNSLKTLDLILSLSKDEARISRFFSSLLHTLAERKAFRLTAKVKPC